MKHGILIGIVTFQIVSLCWAEQPSRGHEWIDDPFVAIGTNKRLTSPAQAWTRGAHTSVQVNTDTSGSNILGDAANEPSIAVHPGDRLRISIGWRQFDTVNNNFRQAGNAHSTDGGRSWTNHGVLDPGVFRSDPVLRFGPDGTLFYDSLTRIDEFDYRCDVFISETAGQTWSGPNPAYGGDKQWIALDRTSGPGHGHFYQAWDYAGCCGNDWFNRSTDGGSSFEYPIPIPDQPYWGVTEVGPDGALYVIGQTISPEVIAVARSSSAQDPKLPMAFDGAFPVDLGGSQVYVDDYGPNPGGLSGQVWIAADHSEEPTRETLITTVSGTSAADSSSQTDLKPEICRIGRTVIKGPRWAPPYRSGYGMAAHRSVPPDSKPSKKSRPSSIGVENTLRPKVPTSSSRLRSSRSNDVDTTLGRPSPRASHVLPRSRLTNTPTSVATKRRPGAEGSATRSLTGASGKLPEIADQVAPKSVVM